MLLWRLRQENSKSNADLNKLEEEEEKKKEWVYKLSDEVLAHTRAWI